MAVFVRPLQVFDLLALGRYRPAVVPLTSAFYLTRGNPLAANQWLAYLDPRRRLYTAVLEADGASCLGQIARARGEMLARLIFVAPLGQVERILPLYEHLIAQAAQWKLPYLTAEVEEHSTLFQTLRLEGFAPYAWQRIWQLPLDVTTTASAPIWHTLRAGHLAEAQSLYAQIVPALLQPIEPLPEAGCGLMCQSGALIAWARVIAGGCGVWVQPLIHPDADCAPEHLLALGRALARQGRRPVYVCVRSYQAWLESLLEDLGAQAGPRQAVMVKRLAITQKSEQPVPKMGKAWAKPTAS